MIHQKISVGDVHVEVHCDASELDAALAKVDHLIARTQQARDMGIDLGTLSVGCAGLVAGSEQLKSAVTRRLFLMPWRRLPR
jgi:tetrahydromethanopterin S-methyltransferase subunit F